MTPRERVIRTLHGEQIHPLPSLLNAPVELAQQRPLDCADLLKRFPNDIDVIRPLRFNCNEQNGFRTTDPMGLTWKLVYGEYQPATPPVCNDVRELAVRTSTPQTAKSRWTAEDELDAIGSFCENNPRFVLLQAPFSLLGECRALLGFEKARLAIHDQSNVFMDFLQRTHHVFMTCLKTWCQSDVDAICLFSGRFQLEGELIPLSLWKELLLPYLREAIQTIRQADKYAIVSTRGNMLDMLPSLKAVGADVVRYDCTQTDAAHLAEQWSGSMAFMPVFPVQNFADRSCDEISEEILNLRRTFEGSCAIVPECDFRLETPYRSTATAVLSWRRRMPIEKLY